MRVVDGADFGEGWSTSASVGLPQSAQNGEDGSDADQKEEGDQQRTRGPRTYVNKNGIISVACKSHTVLDGTYGISDEVSSNGAVFGEIQGRSEEAGKV